MPAWFEAAAVLAPEAVGATVATDVAAEAALSEILAQQAAAAAISSSAMLGAGSGTAGLASLPGYEAFLEQLTSLNPEIVAQNEAIKQVAAVPMSGPTVAPMVKTAATPFFADVGGTGISYGMPFPTGGMQVTAPPVDFLKGMDTYALENPAVAGESVAGSGFVPSDARAFTPPVEGMVDQATGKALEPKSSNIFSDAYDWYKKQPAPVRYGITGLGAMQAAKYLNRQPGVAAPEKYSGPLSKFTYDPRTYRPYSYRPYAAGGPVEQMSNENAIGANTGYPQADIRQGAYATPWQTPVSRNVVAGSGDIGVDQMTGLERMAGGGAVRYADGGLYADPYTNRYIDPNANIYGDPNSAPSAGSERASNAPDSSSTPGQGISSGLTSIGLGLMGIAENAPPGIAAGIANAIGSGIAGSQAAAMGEAMSALSSMSDVPGITTVSDANGNVTGISSPASIAAADAAAGLTGDTTSEGVGGVSGSEGVGGVGGDSGGVGGTGTGVGGDNAAGGLLRIHRYADGGQTYSEQNDPNGLLSLLYNPQMYGMTGPAMSAAPSSYNPSMYSPMTYSPSEMSTSLVDPAAAYSAAQPTMDLSRQNFADFLAQYQNLPGMSKQEIADWSAAHPPETPAPASTDTYDLLPYANPGDMGTPGGSTGARAGGLMASGGISTLGGYSDGGRLLKGPGDGMSDNIPASIGGKQPARLADGEFVVPADVVSGLGNGSTDAGAKHLYAMMDKVRSARTGTKKQGRQINPRKYLPA